MFYEGILLICVFIRLIVIFFNNMNSFTKDLRRQMINDRLKSE